MKVPFFSPYGGVRGGLSLTPTPSKSPREENKN